MKKLIVSTLSLSMLFLISSCGGDEKKDDKKDGGEEKAITAETLPDEYKMNIADFCDCWTAGKGDDAAEMKCLELTMNFADENGLNSKDKGRKYGAYFREISACQNK